MLDQVPADASAPDRMEVSEYRLFCLIALDRKVDARVAIESMVGADPFYQMSTEQASPRVRTMFKDIRQSLLPAIVQREYAAARAAFDKQDPDAAAKFERVMRLLDDPILTSNPSLTDLRTVASGFRDLSKARGAPKVEFAAATAPVVVPPPPAQVARDTTTTAAPAAAASGPAVYREGDTDVVAPVVLNQALPQWVVPQGTRPGAWQPEAVLEVAIDEFGNVSNATLRKSFHPSYDPQLVKAAMSWKYEPARRDGMPVRFIKVVAIRLGGDN
jgi:TonB family protein